MWTRAFLSLDRSTDTKAGWSAGTPRSSPAWARKHYLRRASRAGTNLVDRSVAMVTMTITVHSPASVSESDVCELLAAAEGATIAHEPSVLAALASVYRLKA